MTAPPREARADGPLAVSRATERDQAIYARFGRAAQELLQQRGFTQYVPAAHPEYREAITARIRAGNLYAVQRDGAPLAYFAFERRSDWWPDEEGVRYVAGIVVGPEGRHAGLGHFIVAWAGEQTRAAGARVLRLDCHAENHWLRRYYEALGFELQRVIDQIEGYRGCLYEARVDALPRIAAPTTSCD